MSIRAKLWLLVAASVALTTLVTFALRTYVMRRELVQQGQDAAQAIARDIGHALESLPADASDADLAIVLTRYMQRHPHIQRLQLLVDRRTGNASVRIDAPRGEQAAIHRLGPPARQAEHIYTRRAGGEDNLPVELAVNLQGPWQGALTLHWSLANVESMIEVTDRWSLILGAAHLVFFILVAGLVTDRVLVRKLEVLARAMRDVEGGDLDRRVPETSGDELGRLSRGFNRMLDQLSSAHREIRAFNDRLAGEVDAATRDLSKKNLALAQLNRLLNELRHENASKVRLAALGQLAAQLAHEIGTPLSSVSGHLQLALHQPELTPALRDRLEVATREIARISRIVRDYLDSTRSLEPERKPTSLRQVLSEAIEVARGDGRAGAIELAMHDEPVDFVTDPGLLRQIVINLLTNALDAVEGGGRVTLGARSEGERVLISVGDTGSGIGADDLRRIFEPFYTTKGRGKGTGLGLAICRELVAALGGEIAVESAPGRGSTFTVKLPRRGVPQAPREPARAAAGGGA